MATTTLHAPTSGRACARAVSWDDSQRASDVRGGAGKGSQVTAVSAARHTTKPKITKRTVVLGTTTVTIAAGRSRTLKVALNKTGQTLLKTHPKLKVALTVSEGKKVERTSHVTFTKPKPKPKPKPKAASKREVARRA